MDEADKASADGASWQKAALPNPFMQFGLAVEDILASSDAPILDESDFGISSNPRFAPTIAERSTPEEIARGRAAQKSPPLRGVGLLGAIFAELSAQLGEEFSTAELMKAAQQLIDISKSEYVSETYKDVAERAGYYSWDLVRAFRSHAWQIAGSETDIISHCDAEELSPETYAELRLIQQGWTERMWEF